MSFLFSRPEPAPQPTVITPPQRSDAEIQAAAENERRRLAGAAGRSTTLLTRPSDSRLAPSGATTLLGVAA